MPTGTIYNEESASFYQKKTVNTPAEHNDALPYVSKEGTAAVPVRLGKECLVFRSSCLRIDVLM